MQKSPGKLEILAHYLPAGLYLAFWAVFLFDGLTTIAALILGGVELNAFAIPWQIARISACALATGLTVKRSRIAPVFLAPLTPLALGCLPVALNNLTVIGGLL